MEYDGNIDWNMEEENIRSTVQKGYCTNVGKKLFITGLAISSAPLVLPPLAIISAFGFAASITSGVFLASYACTEKIMSVWLPIPPPPIEEIVEENGYQEEGEDEESETEITIKRDEVSDDVDIDVVVVREDKIDTGSGEAATIEVTSVEFGGNGEGDIEDEEEELKETRGLLERIRDEGRRADDVGDMEMKEANFVALHPHVEYGTSKALSKPAKSEEAEPIPLVTIIDVVESGEDLSVSAVTIESKVLEANAPHKDYKVSSNEEISSEFKIREKIDSMKKIVGYKATPLGTYIDEVNALYTFVGVEPPSPVKDSNDDDLNQLDQKLQFLMSIVGVK